MKPLDEIMVSETTLKQLLGGVDIKYPFPVDGKRKQQVSLQTILNQPKTDRYGSELFDQVASIKSFDHRFDKKHPIILMVEYIKQNSIRKDELSKIYGDSKCIKAHRLVGRYKIYNDLLSDDQIEVIENRLRWENQMVITRKKMAEHFFK